MIDIFFLVVLICFAVYGIAKGKQCGKGIAEILPVEKFVGLFPKGSS